MGFNGNFPQLQTATLANRYGVGEAAEFATVPNPYIAIDNTYWMQSGTWLNANQVSSTVKTRFKGLPTAKDIVALSTIPLTVFQNFNISANAQKHTIGSVTCVQGASLVATFDLSGVWISNPSTWAKIGLTSNATNFLAVKGGGVPATTGSFANSTDGRSWSGVTISGWPASANVSANIYPYADGSANTTAQGFKNIITAAGQRQSVFFWAGARYIVIADDGTNYIAVQSTNGTAWSDQSVTVLGSATITLSGTIYFNRNGNNVYLKVGAAHRFSSDGGANWSAVTPAPTALDDGYLRVNSATPAKLIASSSGNSFYVSTNSGQTWTNQYTALGVTDFSRGVAYLSSTIVVCGTTGNKVSMDDGATWAVLNLPTNAQPLSVTSDANRFYITTTMGIYTSVTGSSWSLLNSNATTINNSVVSVGSNTAFFVGATADTGTCSYTLDAGATFYNAKLIGSSSFTSTGATNVGVVSVGSKTYFYGGPENTTQNQSSFVVDLDDVTAGGAQFRASPSIITPLRTGLTVYIRVE